METGSGPLILTVILLIMCGLICAGVASNKGLSGGGHFLLGLLFGPLGIIITAVSRGDQSRLRQLTPAGVPGWHSDPTGRFDRRYYDGRMWTKHVTRDAERRQFEDPL